MNETDGKNDIENAEAADDASKGRVEKERHQRGKMGEEIVLLPENGPGEIEEQGTHLKAEHDDDGSQQAIHEYENSGAI